MALPPGGSGNEWWDVSWQPPAGAVGARFGTSPAATFQHVAIQAPSASAAQAAANIPFGSSGIGVTGPYATQAEALSQGGSAQQAIAHGQQAGHIPNPLDLWHNLHLDTLFLRIGEVLVGLILLGIGVNGMLKGKPLQVVTGAAGAVGKLVP